MCVHSILACIYGYVFIYRRIPFDRNDKHTFVIYYILKRIYTQKQIRNHKKKEIRKWNLLCKNQNIKTREKIFNQYKHICATNNAQPKFIHFIFYLFFLYDFMLIYSVHWFPSYFESKLLFYNFILVCFFTP